MLNNNLTSAILKAMNNDARKNHISSSELRIKYIPKDFNLFRFDAVFMRLPEEIQIEISRKAAANFDDLWKLSVVGFEDLHLHPIWVQGTRGEYLQVEMCLGTGLLTTGKLTFGVKGLKAIQHITSIEYDPYYGDEIVWYEVSKTSKIEVFQDWA